MTSNDWNAAIDAALSKVREQRAVFSSDAYATPQPLGGFMERFACNSIEVEIEALRKTDTPPTPATDEREAVARAIADALAVDPNDGREREAMQRLHDKCADAALSTLAQVRAAEILAAEANERARIVAWLRGESGICNEWDDEWKLAAGDFAQFICFGYHKMTQAEYDAIEPNEHGAGK